jgi:hypothetical protein
MAWGIWGLGGVVSSNKTMEKNNANNGVWILHGDDSGTRKREEMQADPSICWYVNISCASTIKLYSECKFPFR